MARLESLKKFPKLDALLNGIQRSPLVLGGADMVAGAAGALGGKLGGDERALNDIYSEARDENKAESDAIKKENPYLNAVGGAAGIVGALPMAASGSVARLAGLGAAEGFNQSSADLAHPDAHQIGKAALDTALGAGAGAASGALFNKLRGALSKAKVIKAAEAQSAAEGALRPSFPDGPEIASELGGLVKPGVAGERSAIQSLGDDALAVGKELKGSATKSFGKLREMLNSKVPSNSQDSLVGAAKKFDPWDQVRQGSKNYGSGAADVEDLIRSAPSHNLSPSDLLERLKAGDLNGIRDLKTTIQ